MGMVGRTGAHNECRVVWGSPETNEPLPGQGFMMSIWWAVVGSNH